MYLQHFQYPVRANATKVTITTTTTSNTMSAANHISSNASSHARALVAATAPERPTRYYFRNLEEDMELIASGLAGHQKEGVPPKTHSVYLEDAIDSLGMSSSIDDDYLMGRRNDDDSEQRIDWRARRLATPQLSSSSTSLSSMASDIEQNPGPVDGQQHHHTRGLHVLDRAQFMS
ncbi:hypothetical protein BGZ94_008288 [Podila epigama]|nr:hypothetical protein BGZ94_008288 [Podila epigama]